MAVRLTKIYTRTGDKGTTGLADGSRLDKHDPRVCAYGDVDEANSCLGLAIVACDDQAMRTLLLAIQQDLFDLGADLATPMQDDEQPGQALRIAVEQSERLERTIDQYNQALAPLRSFVLPGGSELAARLHMARAVVRRAERAVTLFMSSCGDTVSPEPLVYLNRLSDVLFVLARVSNNNGRDDVLWQPGSNQKPAT